MLYSCLFETVQPRWLYGQSFGMMQYTGSVAYPHKDTAAQEGVGHWAIVPGVCGIERIVSLQPYMALWYLRQTQGTMTASADPLAARQMVCSSRCNA